MNNISLKQNEKSLLSYQFGARLCYEHVNRLIKILIFTFILMVLVDVFIASQDDYQINKIIITLCLIIFQAIIKRKINEYTKKGAYFKSQFDYSLYDMNLKSYNSKEIEKYEEFLYKIKAKNKRRYIKEISNNGTSQYKGVRDWYFDIDQNLDLEDSVLICQKQNIYFSKKLSKCLLFITLILLLSIIFSATTIYIINKKIFLHAILQLFSLLFFVTLLLRDEVCFLLSNLKIECILNINVPITVDLLIEVQQEIDKTRHLNRLSSRKFHFIKSNKLHELFNIIIKK